MLNQMRDHKQQLSHRGEQLPLKEQDPNSGTHFGGGADSNLNLVRLHTQITNEEEKAQTSKQQQRIKIVLPPGARVAVAKEDLPPSKEAML